MHSASDSKIAYLISCGCALQIAESLFPHPVVGLRLGLANLIVLVVLNLYGIKKAIFVSVFRPLLSSFYLGTFLTPSFFLSFFSSFFSCLVMCFVFVISNKFLSNIGLSVIGAITHNFSQLFFAYILFIRHTGVFVFLPILIIGSVFTGYTTGWAANYVLQKIKDFSVKSVSHVETDIPDRKDIFVKFVLGGLLILFVIIAKNKYWFLILFLLSIIFGIVFGFNFKNFFNKMKILWIILFFSIIAHMFLTPGDIIFNFGFIKITQQGLINSLIMIARIVLIVFVSDVIVYDMSTADFSKVFRYFFNMNLLYIISSVFMYLPSVLENIKNTHPKKLKNLLDSLLVG